MNGIVSEAIYPKLSKDYGGIPIRNFYFDGTQAELQRDLGIYLELARLSKAAHGLLSADRASKYALEELHPAHIANRRAVPPPPPAEALTSKA